MKKYSSLLLALACAGSLHAQDKPDLQTSAYRDSIGQEQVRNQADAVRQKLLQLLDDIQQNQMRTGDFSEAQKAAANLATLNQSQVAPLIEMLKQAGNQQQAADLEAKLASASQSQKSIQLNLKSMADSLEVRKDQTALQARLEQLALRQATNLRQTKALFGLGAAGVKTSPQLDPIINIAQSEQSNLANEIGLAVDTLQKVVQMLPDAEKANFAAALADAQRLNIGLVAGNAADQMAARTFTVASDSEKQVLDGLEGMLLKLKMSQSLQDRLQAMADKLQQEAENQKRLADKTKASDASAQKDIREDQNKISDQVALMQKELAGLNANVLQKTDKAMTAMQAADKTLGDKPLDKPAQDSVAQNQQSAADQLQKASDDLQAQAQALAQMPPQSPLDQAQALSKLDQQVQQAMAAQKDAAANPAAATPAQQQQAAQQAATMQQQALPVSQPAAQALGDAAAQMQQNAPADAAASLAQADAALQQQMQAMAKAAALQQSLQALSDQVAAAKQQAAQAGKDLQDKTQPNPTAAVQQTQAAQQTLDQAQKQAADALPADVKKDLDAAQADLAKSANDAVQSKKDDATAANGDAQKDLDNAMQGLGAALAQAKEGGKEPGGQQPGSQPGQQPGQGPSSQSMMAGNAGQGFEGQNMSNTGFMSSSGPKGGPGQVIGQLNPKDRDAISLLQKEKAPPEYQTMVQQYLKNLADGSTPAKSSVQ